MQTYDLTLAGFQGNGDPLDEDRVKWINAPSEGRVLRFAESLGLNGFTVSVLPGERGPLDFEDGVDVILDEDNDDIQIAPGCRLGDWLTQQGEYVPESDY